MLLKMWRYSLLLVAFPIALSAQHVGIWEKICQGNYLQALSEIESVSPTDNYEILELKAHALYRSYQVEAYHKAIQNAYKADNDKVRAEILLSLKTADYYQLVLRSDSTIYFAHQGMRLFRERGDYLPDSVKCYIYSNYANTIRNWRGPNAHLGERWSQAERNAYLRAYLDTAMQFAVNDEQRADIYMILGTLHTDGLPGYKEDRSKEYVDRSARSVSYLKAAIQLLRSPTRIAHAHALIGLNYDYMLRRQASDNAYQEALNWLKKDSVIQSYEEFLTVCNWRGGNLENWYMETGETAYLSLADSMYQLSIPAWNGMLKSSDYSGVNDGYRVSPWNKLTAVNYKLYLETGQQQLLERAFICADRSKYPTDTTPVVSMADVMSQLDDSTAFVHWVITIRPKVNMVFVLLKDTAIVMEVDRARCNWKFAANMSGESGIHEFKEWSFESYQGYFRPVDSVLQQFGINRLVASHCDECAMLNLDVLISDTLSQQWADQPYLFKRYVISYALSARSYVSSYSSSVSSIPVPIGITLGKYENRSDLRFSKKLVGMLEDNYEIERTDALRNLQNNRIALLLSHADGSMNQRKGQLVITDDHSLMVDEIFKLKLNNELVLVTACNTNSSTSYKGEGAVGNFTKALCYAGSKSTITTSWEIDEKTNAYITERFIHHLASGLDKSTALHLAKKDYWSQNHTTDDMYRPMYWAPYILTGNISPISIAEKTGYSVFGLGAAAGCGLVVLIGIIGLLSIRKSRFAKQ